MSRLANKPIVVPKGVEIKIEGNLLTAKGALGQLQYQVNDLLALEQSEAGISIKQNPAVKKIKAEERAFLNAIFGTTAANIKNVFKGITEGFEKRLILKGVGYRAQLQGKNLNLTLGFSHPVSHKIPEGINVETPTQTEVVVKGIDKQLVGQVSADIRAYRPVEPYKGKGVRYHDEQVIIKETKKK